MLGRQVSAERRRQGDGWPIASASTGPSGPTPEWGYVLKRVHLAGVVPAILGLSGCANSTSEEPKSPPPPVPVSLMVRQVQLAVVRVAIGSIPCSMLHGSWARTPLSCCTSTATVSSCWAQAGAGGLSSKNGVHAVRLKCDDGNTDHAVGKVWGLSQSSMTVDWEGFGADTFRRSSWRDCSRPDVGTLVVRTAVRGPSAPPEQVARDGPHTAAPNGAPQLVQPPHWHGAPDWQPQPQPEPQPHAARTRRWCTWTGACC